MMPSSASILPLLVLISGSIVLAGCGRSATTISYRQVGMCKTYGTADGPVTARSGEGFAIFEIEAVDNTKSSEGFDFDPTHLYVDQSTPEQKAKPAVWDRDRRFVYPDQRFAQSMGVPLAVETTIPRGAIREINSFVVVPVSLNGQGGRPQANSYSYDLIYDTWSTDEHETNAAGGSFAFVVVLLQLLVFGGPELASKNIHLNKTNADETVLSVTDHCKALSFK
ncbi:MAG TPA: hypothetical protein VFG05_05045 [Methylocella sp.]|nr:hypothetical protein [Methylocella sp.]